ncbi:MAG: sigma-54-dependent Fis family transcriptional regulator [Myxococcaceae bacterium]|jgi:transcriptional regulator of acetoin/glycerol metabolism|nr:sigma-54-dependent Fis family transcriptional regulator [Myxococcaceae bacterium]
MRVEMEHRLIEASTPLLREVRESWSRCAEVGLSRELRAAPLVLDEEGLFTRRQRSPWLVEAEAALAPHIELVQGSGHVLTLFDTEGIMLASAGDPFVLEQLDDIHFVPGANWSEERAGTNGPGTALATRRPAHIVGPEHFCGAWHPWHCAAVPVWSPAGDLLGALDVSGPARRADSRIFALARLLGTTVEQALRTSALERQARVLSRYAELCVRAPGEALVAVDAEGVVLQATGAAKARGLPERLLVPPNVTGLQAGPPQASWLAGATVVPLVDGGRRVGACLVQREAARRPSRRALAVTPNGTRYTFADLAGAGLREVVALARSVAPTTLPVLVTGESGVGKEVVAQAIHVDSARPDGPFVAVNCAALARDLVESELFGYVGGAFSGARSNGAPGRFEAAHGGTLFLDEVGELPPTAQAALLRALQEKVITPVGGTEARQVDVRLIAATNRDLSHAVKVGLFRLDLLHRLNVIEVKVPPLRERLGDLPVLVEHLSAVVESELGLPVRLGDAVRERLARHDWPGNVRELENVLRRLAVLGRERPVTEHDLPFDAAAPVRLDGQVQRLLDVIHSTKNMAEAAARLGINRSTLYRQLERLGLKPGRTATPGS